MSVECPTLTQTDVPDNIETMPSTDDTDYVAYKVVGDYATSTASTRSACLIDTFSMVKDDDSAWTDTFWLKADSDGKIWYTRNEAKVASDSNVKITYEYAGVAYETNTFYMELSCETLT